MAFTNPFSKLSHGQLIAVLIGGGLIGVYAEYQHHKTTGSWSPFSTGTTTAGSTSTAAAGSPGTVTDPTTGQEYSDTAVDPSTQMTYASEISQYGSVTAAEAEVSQFGGSPPSTSSYDTGYTYAQQTDNLTTANGQNIYTSNSAWSQAVQAGLSSVSGSTSYDGTDIGEALGLYLQGEPLSPGQVNVINVALSEYGKPPVGTFQIIPASTATTGTTTTSTKPTAPYPGPSGLTVKHTSGTSYTISWKPITGTAATGPTPTSYTVEITNAATGARVAYTTVSTPDAAGSTGTTTVTLPKVTKSTKYNVTVWANGTTGIAPKNSGTTITET